MIKLRAIADCAIDLEKARIDGSSEIHFGILAHLIVERGKPVARATLVDAFWWNSDDAEGRHCLRQAIYKLRQMGVPIDGDGDSFTLGERAALADFDCADERTLALSPLPPEQAVAIFPGYAPRASAPFLTWLERTREKAGRAVRGVLVRALGEARRRNGWEEAAKLARQCLVLDPLNEEATLTLAEYTALQGDKREALRLIDSYMEEIGGTYGDLRIPASLLRNRISERMAYPPASAAGKIALVGREASLRALAGVATEVGGGAGHTFVIHGPPGIGKTRLITEFANISAMKGARIVRVECHADGAERALSVFMELAPQLLRMPGALGCSPEALRLVRRLGRHDPNERLDPDEYGGPEFLHAAVRASLRDLIDAIAAERPLYLMIEDVHWIDPISLEVLKEIIGSNRGRPLLVLMTTRTLGDGELLRGVDRRQLIVHELEPLDDAGSRRLAETLCGALAIQADGKLVEWCMQRGAGNPLFMTELLAHWRETKDMERVPASLEALIDERVGALSEAALRTLQAIALLEGEATYEMLEAVLGMQRWQVMKCIEELDKQGLIIASAGSMRAGHDLISARAVECLSPLLRKSLHLHVAQELERCRTAAPDPRTIWRAARHYAAADERTHAVRLSIEASAHLGAIGAQMRGALLLKDALLFASNFDERMLLFDRRRTLLMAASAYDEAVLNSREALADQEAVAGRRRVHNDHELASFGLRQHPTTVPSRISATLRDAYACATATDATFLHRLKAAFYGLASASNDGHSDWADKLFGAASGISCGSLEERVYQLKCELVYHTLFGSILEAVKSAGDLQALIPQLDLEGKSAAHRVCGYVLEFAGQLHAAREKFSTAYAAGAEARLAAYAGTALINIGGTYSFEEQHEMAWEYFAKGANLFKATEAPELGSVLTAGAEFAFLRGDVATGVSLSQRIPHMQQRRFQIDRCCLAIFAKLAQGGKVTAPDLTHAKNLFWSMARLGVMDFPAGSLVRAISQIDASEAREFALRYAEERRERCAVGNPYLLAFLR